MTGAAEEDHAQAKGDESEAEERDVRNAEIGNIEAPVTPATAPLRTKAKRCCLMRFIPRLTARLSLSRSAIRLLPNGLRKVAWSRTRSRTTAPPPSNHK